MADLPLVDTHVHYFDLQRPPLRYSWLEADAPLDDFFGPDGAIRAQRYWPDDFLAETRFHNVSKVVHVQAALGTEDPVEETRWLQELSDRIGVPQGVIAALDLTADDAAETLARHAAFPVMRGVRDLRQDDYLSNAAWEAGIAVLERHGDLVLCDSPEVEEMVLLRDIAHRHPEVTFCIDHAGLPKARDDEYLLRWGTGLSALAEADNCVVKISGLGMGDHRWTVSSLRPWVLGCIEAFGVERAFFGTNWPLDRLYSSYGDVIDAYAELVSDFSPSEQEALFSKNAERIFRLEGS